MRILLTGNKGFIGSRLEIYLTGLGYTVIGLDIKDQLDINTAPLPECDIVIHLAGIGGVRESLANPKLYWDTNVEGTKRILKHYHNKRVLVAGSSSQYEPHLNPYAASKHLIESIPHSNVCFMRFHTVYSENSRKGMFFDKLLHGKLDYITTHERDFIYLDDMCMAIITIIRATQIKGAFDIGTGITTKMTDICPDLPIKIHTVGERHRTCANTHQMNSLGFKPLISVLDFIKKHKK